MNKSKIFNFFIIAFLLINTSLVVFLLLKKDKHLMPPPPQQQGGPFNFLVSELQLDTNQIAQYKVLRDQHKNAIDSIRAQIREAKDFVFNAIKNSNSSDTIVQRKFELVAKNEKNILEITFNHFKQVRSICNATQQAKFDTVIATVMKMQMPHHPQDRRDAKEERRMREDENRPPPPDR